MCKELFLEAFVVGVMCVLVGSFVGFCVSQMMDNELPVACRNWNQNHVMELSLFLTGFCVHILCELFFMNSWYCLNSVACTKLKNI